MLDWEWSGPGGPLTDLAWAERVVRAHHPQHVAALDGLFAGYGAEPPWPERRRAVRRRAELHLAFAERWRPGGGVWADRVAVIDSW